MAEQISKEGLDLEVPEEVIEEVKELTLTKEKLIREIEESSGLVNWVKTQWGYIIAVDMMNGAICWFIGESRHLPRTCKRLHAVLTGDSGLGKTHALDSLEASFTPDSVKSISSMSRKSLSYHAEELKEAKVFIVEQIEGIEFFYDLLIALDKGRLDHWTVDDLKGKEVGGEVNFSFITSTVEVPKEKQFCTRVFILPMDGSPEANREVIRFMAELEADKEKRQKRTEALHKLRALDKMVREFSTQVREIWIPFADKIPDYIPDYAYQNSAVRRKFRQLLDLIKVIALIYGALGKRKLDKGELVAEIEDWEEAKKLIDIGRESLQLTSKEEEVLLAVGRLEDKYGVNTAQIKNELNWNQKTIWKYCRSLIEKGFLTAERVGKGNVYYLTDLAREFLEGKEVKDLLQISRRRLEASSEQKEAEVKPSGTFSLSPRFKEEDKEKDKVIPLDSGEREKVETEEAEAPSEQKEKANLLREIKRRLETSVPRKCGNCRHYDPVRKTCKKYRFKEELLSTHEACSRFEPKSG